MPLRLIGPAVPIVAVKVPRPMRMASPPQRLRLMNTCSASPGESPKASPKRNVPSGLSASDDFDFLDLFNDKDFLHRPALSRATSCPISLNTTGTASFEVQSILCQPTSVAEDDEPSDCEEEGPVAGEDKRGSDALGCSPAEQGLFGRSFGSFNGTSSPPERTDNPMVYDSRFSKIVLADACPPELGERPSRIRELFGSPTLLRT
jgi:hypothetical protein